MSGSRGLTHLQIAVTDMTRSLRFYKTVFGMMEKFPGEEDFVFLTTPGRHDTFTLNSSGEPSRLAGQMGGIQHFGFQVADAAEVDRLVERVPSAGGRVLRVDDRENGRFAFVSDPDGYKIEIFSE